MTENKYNVEAAEASANEALHLPIADAVPLYEQLLSTYPTAAKFWKQYVDAQMAVNNDDATKHIFSRCLLNCLQVPLWRSYIRFIRKVNEKKGIDGLEETRKAFDFMLNYVGSDIGSGPIWMEYISFLKSLPVQTAQEETHRMTAVRKAYQKAIVTPTHHIEQLWRDYESFESSVSRALAKGLLSDYQPKFNSARAVYRELKKYIDEIDWSMLAVPPTGSYKEEQQWMAWKRLLAFEKGNPQRIDSASSNKRIVLAYEQCLMYLYHCPDIWYDYATWHAKSGSVDAALKIFQRALKALPDSDILKYAYAELEESHGAIQPAKKIYQSLLGDCVNATALAHIQYIRFLRRTEGIEAARKYFLDIRKSPNCTYQVYVAYAMMAFCLDKDPKIAHKVFEDGLKRFMHEPGYILEYADFLSRLNDDRNVRALFERALSSLPPEETVEVWKRFIEFEQMYGDLASMLKVEQRRKEAFSWTGEGSLLLEDSLQDVVSRYTYMDLWPCSSKDLDHLARQEWLAKSMDKKVEKSSLLNGASDKDSSGLATSSSPSKVVYPDITQMMIYDPGQKVGPAGLLNTAASELPSSMSVSASPLVGNEITSAFDGILKVAPPALAAFIANLPPVEGPAPDVDFVLSICLQSNIPMGQASKSGAPLVQKPASASLRSSEFSGQSKSHLAASASSARARDRQAGKRKERHKAVGACKVLTEGSGCGGKFQGRRRKDDFGQLCKNEKRKSHCNCFLYSCHEDDETTTVHSQPLPKDVFKIRQMQKSRPHSRTASQTGSTSYGSVLSGSALSGSAISGEHSGSTG